MTSRKATFGTALRILDLIDLLGKRRTEWSVADAAAELGVHPKTIHRYIAALESRFVRDDGEPSLRLEYRGKKPVITVSGPLLGFAPAIFDYASLFFAAELFGFAAGTQLQKGLDRVAQQIATGLPAERRTALARFQRKFFIYHTGVHKPADEDVMGDILSGLINERRLAVRYNDWPRARVIEPLSLAVYKEGLYLIARIPGKPRAFVMSVPLIKAVEYRPRDRFAWPEDWSPAAFRGDSFGMLPGETVRVALRFRKPLRNYLESRSWHASQKLAVLDHGELRVTLQVSQSPELVSWICGFGPDVVVERPPALREAVRKRLAGAIGRY